jgi:hypothetical protein
MPTPSILLIPDRYKSAVLYSQIPDSGAVDFDVTRATTAYRTNASGVLESVASGVPRLDYPAAGGCPALLVEPAATNLALRSEEFDNASWAKTNTTISANAINAPNGALTADLINESVVSGFQAVEQVFTSPASGTYTFSCFLKQGTQPFGGVRAVVNGFTNRHFVLLDLSNGTIAGTNTFGSGVTWSSSVVSFSNGWYRVSITALHTSGNASITISSAPNATPTYQGALPNFLGNALNNISAWGAQLETGSVATSYIPTVAATATRNADVISKTGVSGFIGQTEGSIYVEAFIPKVANNFVIGISDGAVLGEAIYLQVQSNLNLAVRIRSTSLITDLTITAANWSAGLNKVAASYGLGTNNCAISINGGNAITATATAIPTCESIVLGSRPDAPGGLSINDRIRAAAVYTTRLSNTELAALTTL